ncbi:MAG TPA: hypothetical protein VGI83_03830 [Gemmatimonadales bacterium]
MFERLKAAINSALASSTPAADPKAQGGLMREAAVEARSAVDLMKRDLALVEKQLAAEREQLADVVRRGDQARQINDTETVEVAERFQAKHAEKIGVLERKAEAQRAELVLAEKELGEIVAQLKAIKESAPADANAKIEGAWRAMQAAGGARPGDELEEHEILKTNMDRAAREATADQQLQELKKRMGK